MLTATWSKNKIRKARSIRSCEAMVHGNWPNRTGNTIQPGEFYLDCDPPMRGSGLILCISCAKASGAVVEA